MLCKILIINMLDYKFKRFIFNIKIKVLLKTFVYAERLGIQIIV